jgi:hypothetical protein
LLDSALGGLDLAFGAAQTGVVRQRTLNGLGERERDDDRRRD